MPQVIEIESGKVRSDLLLEMSPMHDPTIPAFVRRKYTREPVPEQCAFALRIDGMDIPIPDLWKYGM